MPKSKQSDKGRKGRKKNVKRNKSSSTQITRSEKAGLTFPVGRIFRFLKNGGYIERVGGSAPVYMCAVLEYICAEVLELSGNAAKDNKKQRITPRHIQLAVRSDEELNILFGNAIIASGGVLPNIHEALIPNSKKGKGKNGKIQSQSQSKLSDSQSF